MLLRLSVGLFLLGVVACDGFTNIGYRDCKSQFKVQEVKAQGCDLKEIEGKKVCLFKENSRPVIRIKFTPDQDVADFKTSIKAKIGEAMINFPLANPDACSAGLNCPLKAGQDYVYEQAIDIGKNYPNHEKVQVNWVVDREGAPGKDVCIIFLASISQ